MHGSIVVDMDFNKIPRLMADQISMNYSDKVFNMGFRTGDAYHGFILLPEAAKVLTKMLTEQVAAYEKQYGEIDASRAEGGIESPIQIN